MDKVVGGAAFKRLLVYSVALPLSLCFILAGVLLYEVMTLLEASRWVDHTDQVIAEANYLKTLILDLETGERGYLITGKMSFFKPYQEAEGKVQPEIDKIKDLVKDNPALLARAGEIETGVNAWKVFAVRIFKMRQNGGDWVSVVSEGQGIGLIALLRDNIGLFIDDAVALRDTRAHHTHQLANRVMTIVTGGTIFAGLLVALFGRAQILRLSRSYEGQADELRKSHTELEKRVEERTTELSAANKELEAFAYSVSHDLRAPLRGLDGFSQALIEDYGDKLDETARHYLQRIRLGSQRMGMLIDDLLKLSRLTRAQVNKEKVNLSDVAEKIAARLRESDPHRETKFIIAPDVIVEGDPGLLEAALDNLLSNAWKFTTGKPDAVIEFGATKEKGQDAYFVRDNGAGFDMAYSDKLFGAFQRLHGAKEFPGTGIGLATVRRIINKHGGKIWADAAVGRGATFEFTLSPA